jgi:hypothetical protein
MQNRGMFPYRRHGGKKRGKGPAHQSRGSQRPLPNSARDLLPLLQPATKALAQMLAGRTGVSGQLNHARNLLAHAERLINDRVHNRLIPAEREEFFEQLARLRLTLADAEAEAEVQAAEEQVEKAPPRPVAHERLKEMALALTRPERERVPPPRPPDEAANSGPEPSPAAGDRTIAAGGPGDELAASRGAAEQQDRPPLRPLADLPGRLVLSRTAGEKARGAITEPAIPSRGRRSRQPNPDAAPPAAAADDGDREADAPAPGDGAGGDNGAAAAASRERKPARRTRKTKDGLPEGWVIDEEGFVVPRHG